MSEAATGVVLTAMITRPAGQAESLLNAIRAAGYTALEFP